MRRSWRTHFERPAVGAAFHCVPMAHALLAGHLDFDAPDRPIERPNIARMLFLDPHMRELYGDWQCKARSTVADLRLIDGRYPDDLGVTALVGELTVSSPQFVRLWAAHTVGDCGTDPRTYHHPTVGTLALHTEFMTLPNDGGQRVAVFNAEPGSPSEAALRLLAALTIAPARADAAVVPPPGSSHSSC